MIETQIIDDVLPQAYANEIEQTLFHHSFPWYFIEDVTFGNTYKLLQLDPHEKTPAFAHVFFDEDKPTSSYFNLVKIIPYLAFQKATSYNTIKFIQARSFLQMPLTKYSDYNNIHTDMKEKHIVCLYYVNDVDGDTFLFDKNGDISQRITPKKNRVVLFDGSIQHASSTPTFSKRAIINFDVILNQKLNINIQV